MKKLVFIIFILSFKLLHAIERNDFNEDRFHFWKMALEQKFSGRAEEINRADLLIITLKFLDTVKENLATGDMQHALREAALFAYNFLREKHNLPIAFNFQEIDRKWLEDNACHIYLQGNVESLKSIISRPIDTTEKMFLLSILNPFNPYYVPANIHESYLVCTYNQLRVLYDKPAIQFFNTIDYDWLKEVELDVLQQLAEEVNQEFKRTSQTPQSKQQEQLQEDDETSEAKQLYDLLTGVYDALEGTGDVNIALPSYNLLREKLQLPLAQDASQIDQDWLKKQDYILWKSYFKSVMQVDEKGSLLVYKLLDAVFRPEVREHLDSFSPDKVLIHAYNYLRELKHRRLIKSINEIDWDWLDAVADQDLVMGFVEPTFAQREILREAYVQTNLDHALKLVSTLDPQHAMAFYKSHTPEIGIIALSPNPDLQQGLFVVYHELWHIIDVKPKLKFMFDKNYAGLLSDSQFQEDVKRVDYYTELGKNVLDESSAIGKHLSTVNKLFKTFWLQTEDNGLKDKLLYEIGSEKRADLFALEQLYKQNKLSAILSMIHFWGSGRYEFGKLAFVLDNRKNPEEYHPSYVERALYMIGFLADKDIDINKALREWEKNAQCIDAEAHYRRKRNAHRIPYTINSLALKDMLQV